MALLAAGCGASTGLQVANSGRTTPVSTPAATQPRVGRLDAVAFPSTTRGWAAGSGAIIATSDGGANWTRQYRGGADIRALDFIDTRHGWAVASHSLLRTSDGGASWSPAAEPQGLLLTSVDFVSADQGWGIALPPGSIGEPALGTLVRSARRRRQLVGGEDGGRRLGLRVGWHAGRRRRVEGAQFGRRRPQLAHAARRPRPPDQAMVHGDRAVPRPALDLGAFPGRSRRRQPGLCGLHHRRRRRRLAAGGGVADPGGVRPGIQGRHPTRRLSRPVRGHLRVAGGVSRPVPRLRAARDGAPHRRTEEPPGIGT